jgi:L-histidine N-alpha-methyltransferase
MKVSQEPTYADGRLKIERLAGGRDNEAFARDIRAGLTTKPKWLPAKYFYDQLGSRLFEAICCLPEYYLTRAEAEILSLYANEMADVVKAPKRLIELGSGSAEKTRFLIDAFMRRQEHLHYIPVDISRPSIELSSKELLRLFPGLTITGYAADYFTALEEFGHSRFEGRTVALFLGSNIGNFAPDDALEFLRRVRSVLEPGDVLLLGADLKKPAEILVPAYDDRLGVTAAFNLNLLVRINRELGGDFDIGKFSHRALYNEPASRIEMHLVSRERQVVSIAGLDLRARFDEGESIHSESSYKYDLDLLTEYGHRAGFSLVQTWFDPGRRFSFNMFSATNERWFGK